MGGRCSRRNPEALVGQFVVRGVGHSSDGDGVHAATADADVEVDDVGPIPSFTTDADAWLRCRLRCLPLASGLHA